MKKFRYIIWDSFDGCFKGTDDTSVANDFATSEDFAVYDTEHGMWLYDGEGHDIVPILGSEGND